MKLEERELNPRDIVKHVVRTATVASKDRGLSIQAEIADDVPNMVLFQPTKSVNRSPKMGLPLCRACSVIHLLMLSTFDSIT